MALWPETLLRPYRLVAFDWDGTAVENRQADATPLWNCLEKLLACGIRIAIITGTKAEHLLRQMPALPAPLLDRLWLCTNRGSEVYGFEGDRPYLLWQRMATSEEEASLTEVAEGLREALQSRTGLRIDIIYNRLNRRKVDLIPDWPDPPKSSLGELLAAVDNRLKGAGLSGGLREAFEMAEAFVRERHLPHFRVTSDVKHLEIGLSDKSDAIDWVIDRALGENIAARDILVGGDEFGDIAGFSGSDAKMITPLSRDATFVSVGIEPNGVPAPVIHLGGGPPRFLALLEALVNLCPRQTAELCWPLRPTADAGCVLVEEGFNLLREHELQALFTVSNGLVGTLGSLAEGSSMSVPATLVAGLYQRMDGLPELAVLPDWTVLRLYVTDSLMTLEKADNLEHRRILDMCQGLLWREWLHRDLKGRMTRMRYLRFASFGDRHLLVQSVLITPENYSGNLRLESLLEQPSGEVFQPASQPEVGAIAFTTPGTGINVAVATRGLLLSETGALVSREWGQEEGRLAESWKWRGEVGRTYRLDRVVSLYTSREVGDPQMQALESLRENKPLETLLMEHRRAWDERWHAARLEVGQPTFDQALCFATYHLLSAGDPQNGCVSIGPRGLTGYIYQGHIFWDTEIFLLPFYAHTWPEVAKALLSYRYYTLPEARKRAHSFGYQGALYPWESVLEGEDATPPFFLAPNGEVLPVYSGKMAHHVSAAVAHAVWNYWQATQDDAFMQLQGAEILFETARFWASRGQWEADGKYHIRHVLGPDEYHVNVDDDAYTNGMAQWNLECALETAELLKNRWPDCRAALFNRLNLTESELENWKTIAPGIYTGLDPSTGLIEQFQGYFALEDIPLEKFHPRPVPMDILLGRERIQGSQVIKQADVVMLLFLLWDRYSPEVREKNFRYYEDRCGHGSSLSPPVHALVAAKLGDIDLAECYFRQTAEIDLANNMGNASGGVHIGALGGLWQAVALGVMGLQPRADGLQLAPLRSEEWCPLIMPFQFQGRRLQLRMTRDATELTLQRGEPLNVYWRNKSPQLLSSRLKWGME